MLAQDGEGTPIYLDSASARSLPFFERVGFKMVCEVTTAGSMPKFWCLVRAAHGHDDSHAPVAASSDANNNNDNRQRDDNDRGDNDNFDSVSDSGNDEP